MASSSMGVAMYPADERGCRVKLRDWETLCFTEYVSDCSVPLPCRLDRRRLYSNSNFGVRASEWSADRNLPLLSVQAHVSVMVYSCSQLAVTKNAVTNSAVRLVVRLVSGFRISPAVAKL